MNTLLNLKSKHLLFIIVTAIISIFVLTSIGRLWEDVDAGEVVVVQDPFDGDLHVYKEPGWVWQGYGKATHYRKSNQFWFNSPKDSTEKKVQDRSIPVQWSDGAPSSISGSIRYDLPLDEQQIIKIHSIFGSQEALEQQLIKTNLEKSVYMTGPLMSSKESYAEKKNDLIFYIEDQVSRGVYKTRQVETKIIDELTNDERTITKVEIVEKDGLPLRQEKSPIAEYGIRVYNISVNKISYSNTVENQIRQQQKAIMDVQLAVANAKKAEQDAITVAKQGEANAAKAKWEQEVIKAKLVTEAESRKKVSELEVLTAENNKRKMVLEGEGEAAKKRAIMQADGALKDKLDAWVKSQQFWAQAFANYKGNVVPYYVASPNSGGYTNGATQFMEIMGMKAARDLNLDMSNK